MSKVITIVNQKGGVGKTTTAVNLGAYLNKYGKSILLIDLDPQANATSGVGIDHTNLEHSVYNVLIHFHPIEGIIKETPHSGYFIVPSTKELAGARIELVEINDREYRLKNALQGIREDYNYIIVDCPPSLDLLTINGLVAADEVLIPIQSEYYALEGLGQLLGTIQLVQENLKPELKVMGGVITMFDKRNKLSKQVVDELYKHFPYKIFNSVIPRSVRLAESPSYGQSISIYDPLSRGAKAYEQLAQEIMNLEVVQTINTEQIIKKDHFIV